MITHFALKDGKSFKDLSGTEHKNSILVIEEGSGYARGIVNAKGYVWSSLDARLSIFAGVRVLPLHTYPIDIEISGDDFTTYFGTPIDPGGPISAISFFMSRIITYIMERSPMQSGINWSDWEIVDPGEKPR